MASTPFHSDVLTNTHTRTLEFTSQRRKGVKPPGAQQTKGERGPHWADPTTRGEKPEPSNSYAANKKARLRKHSLGSSKREAAELQRQAANFRANPVASHKVPASRSTATMRAKSAAGRPRRLAGAEMRSPNRYLPAYARNTDASVFSMAARREAATRLHEEAVAAQKMARNRERDAERAALAFRGGRLNLLHSAQLDPGAEFDAKAHVGEAKRRAAFLRSTLPDGRITGESLGLGGATAGMAADIAAETVLESFGEHPTLSDTAGLATTISRGARHKQADSGENGVISLASTASVGDDVGFRPPSSHGRLGATSGRRKSSLLAMSDGLTVTAAGTVLRRTSANRAGTRPPPLSPVKAPAGFGAAPGAGSSAGEYASLGASLHSRPATANSRLLSTARVNAAVMAPMGVQVSPVRARASPVRRAGPPPLSGGARTFVNDADGTKVTQPAATAAVIDSGAVARMRRERLRAMRDACR